MATDSLGAQSTDPHALDQVSLLRMLQLSSASLPVGAFAWSHGMEQAVAVGLVHDEASAAGWLLGVAEHSVAAMDVPVLRRLHRAWREDDGAAVEHWNRLLCASRETSELAQEDHQMALALARLLADLGVAQAASWRRAPVLGYPTMHALACVHWQVNVDLACASLLYSFCENQVAAAIKLVPLGQTAGQRLLGRALAAIPDWCARGLDIRDEDIATCTPGLGAASVMHEQLYTRLFRS